MNARLLASTAALIALSSAATRAASAQSLNQRIVEAPAALVEFRFATRAGVCGDGQTYVHLGSRGGSAFYGSFDEAGEAPCVAGPARVVLERAAGQVVALRVFVGPRGTDGATDLGVVSPGEASRYLLHLAATAQGAVARDAIMPAMLADSADNQAALVALVRDQSRSHDLRRSAIAWLGRGIAVNAAVPGVLVSIATDDTDNQSVRQQALSTLARLDGGVGIPALTHLADDPDGGWVARGALAVIAQSGDPRARDYLRGVVRKAALPDQALAVAVRSFAQSYATAADIATIRDAWPRFTGDRTRRVAILAVAEFGGAANTSWLVSLYDRTTDPDTKAMVISTLGEIGDRAAVDKLLAIARTDESLAARRRAISVLGRTSDPRVKVALEALVEGSPRR
ncbi:MAG: HEAT repeat domain-containing protein [Gemmatimonadaceae bacterium]